MSGRCECDLVTFSIWGLAGGLADGFSRLCANFINFSWLAEFNQNLPTVVCLQNAALAAHAGPRVDGHLILSPGIGPDGAPAERQRRRRLGHRHRLPQLHRRRDRRPVLQRAGRRLRRYNTGHPCPGLAIFELCPDTSNILWWYGNSDRARASSMPPTNMSLTGLADADDPSCAAARPPPPPMLMASGSAVVSPPPIASLPPPSPPPPPPPLAGVLSWLCFTSASGPRPRGPRLDLLHGTDMPPVGTQ